MAREADSQPSLSQGTDDHSASFQLFEELNQKCSDLLNEIDELQSLLNSALRRPQLVELRQFRAGVNSELRMLQRLEGQTKGHKGGYTTEADPEVAMRLLHALHSSNLPFYQAVWNAARGSCTGLVAMGKRFYWGSAEQSRDQQKKEKKEDTSSGTGKPSNKDKRKSIFVDIVADDGKAWVKVSTISESRLIFEMAKKGWEGDSEDEFSDGDSSAPPKRTILRNFDGEDSGEDSDDDELELIKLARDLRKAADATRVRYKHPQLRIILPKIEEGNVPEIDGILKKMRGYGIKVECKNSLPALASPAPLSRLLPQPFKNFTSTLNVDCTLLLAIVSDLSHFKEFAPTDKTHSAILRQVELEKEQPLLPTEIWPAMGGRELVCTKEAAARMREIIDTLGTETEKQRVEIIFGDPPNDQLERRPLIEKIQNLSNWPVPVEWRLPVKVVEAREVINAAREEGKFPPIARDVMQGLSEINHSIFMYGWATGMTTISSNRSVDRQIEATIENSRKGVDDDVEGPQVWVCETARSLRGKDRDRKEPNGVGQQTDV
ncbi:hypothetical protein N7532_005509 [Penicillium argentinense]|uniref:DUF1308 domain-containing protein n=1 Tax=Penicillium argentinense TaxID=1131581 RepID=A0A9W9FE13_9EURO|nr:uncharacterized protein N7532_005509 [Penicillium argentinense]KAJ5098508.1 hypothetical protein N7532_005509 [Penicillium argentinense]